MMLVQILIQIVHVSAGPHGWVAWVQPDHITAGIGWVHGHLVDWFQVQS